MSWVSELEVVAENVPWLEPGMSAQKGRFHRNLVVFDSENGDVFLFNGITFIFREVDW
jgi:hypothetical protein